MKYQTYATGYYATPSFDTKKQARAWCRKVAKLWVKMGLPRYTYTKLDRGEEHWRSETESTLDACGFKPV